MSDDFSILDYFSLYPPPHCDQECRCSQYPCIQTFQRELKEYFGPIASAAKSNGKLDRSIFRTAHMNFAHKLNYAEAASVYYGHILDTLDEFISRGSRDMTAILNEFATKRLESYGFKFVSPNAFKYSRTSRHRTIRIKIPVQEREFTLCSLGQLLQKHFLFQDFDFVKRLVRYVTPVKFVMDDLVGYSGRLRLLFRDFFLMCVAVPQSVRFNYKRFETYRKCLSPRRCKLLVMSIDFIRLKRCFGDTYAFNTIKSLRLFFEYMPDVWISSREVYDFMIHTHSGVDSAADSIIQDFCRNFEEDFPESVRPPQPRSLKHLARCEIRKHVSSSGHLPHGVHKLGLPEALKEYVVFENTF